MQRGLYPSLLILALSLPGAAGALGLGDIHVESALNEPLSAQIDIVGATDEELTALRAEVASRETFLHYGAERAAFLSTASFKVTRAPDGRATLAVRSDQAVTDPLVTLLVDLSWSRGELIKEYSLLLDPAAPAAAAARVP
jgi:pilus assembly protein FimV